MGRGRPASRAASALLHGFSDTTIPFESSAVFETVLAEAGYDVELIGLPPAGLDCSRADPPSS